MAKTFCFLKWCLENWEERRLRSVPNIHPSHVCLKEKKNVCLCFSIVDCFCLCTVMVSKLAAAALLKLGGGGGALPGFRGFFVTLSYCLSEEKKNL